LPISIVASTLIFLEQLSMKYVKGIAQSYGRASVMLVQHSGVQILMKEPFIYHRLNLIIVDACKNIIISYFLKKPNKFNLYDILECKKHV
jgi:hypothetical protein